MALVKDLMSTALAFHTLICLTVNLYLTIGFLIYVAILGFVMVLLGNYGAIFREQKKLIDEIRSI